jgi:dTDP-4-dehydrorhamnose 3,5-epimerase
LITRQELPINGACLLRYGRHEDQRGWFQKTHNMDLLDSYNLDTDIREMYTSLSNKNVIRGMHFQIPPKDHAKYITVMTGAILDVMLDLRRSSMTFGQCFSVELDAADNNTLYLPKGIAHGFLSLQDNTLTQYAVTSTYAPDHDKGILWSSIPFEWPVASPIISGRDVDFPAFDDFESPFA